MLVGAIRDSDDVTTSELELARLLRREIIQGLHQSLEIKKIVYKFTNATKQTLKKEMIPCNIILLFK